MWNLFKDFIRAWNLWGGLLDGIILNIGGKGSDEWKFGLKAFVRELETVNKANNEIMNTG